MSERSEYPLIRLSIVIPCFNEDKVLQNTIPQFLSFLETLISHHSVTSDSFLMFVDDGSTDLTWAVITQSQVMNPHPERIKAIRLSTNKGHQNALIAGTKKAYDLGVGGIITIDCDGQDDMNAMLYMLCEHYEGADIVYGVRKNRKTDSWFKKTTAQIFYKILKSLGDKSIYNHADSRFLSRRVLTELLKYGESNLYLRGMIPLIGFKESIVYYNRQKRISGKTHYSLKKMLHLASNGITNTSTKPLHAVLFTGLVMSLLFLACVIIYALFGTQNNFIKDFIPYVAIDAFFTSINLFCISIIAEYIAKIHMEVKHRPLYHIMEEFNTKETSHDYK